MTNNLISFSKPKFHMVKMTNGTIKPCYSIENVGTKSWD